MKKRIKNVTPLQLGKMLATLYAVLAVVLIPFMLIGVMFSKQPKMPGIILAIILPMIYIALGFLFGVIGAFVYNLCAKWIGGVEVEVE
jgi:hypothetical protein